MSIDTNHISMPSVGFGTSGIMGSALFDYGRLKILNAAFDSGIRHYDTAPLYGLGEAEKILGKFAKSNRHDIAIVTKYGLFPPPINWVYRCAAPLVRPIYHRNLKIKQLLNKKLSIDQNNTSLLPVCKNPTERRKPYDCADIERSLNQSLHKLNTDYVDCLLLHDSSAYQIDCAVVELLNKLVMSGKIKNYGIAGSQSEAESIFTTHENFIGVLQIADSILSPLQIKQQHSNIEFTIVHSILNRVVEILHNKLTEQKLYKLWANTLDWNMFDRNSLATFLLSQARYKHPENTILFSSKHIQTIRNNTVILQKPPITQAQALLFETLVRKALSKYPTND